MLSSLLAPFVGTLIRELVSQLIGGLFGYFDRLKADAAQRDVGRLEAERDQAVEGIKAQQEMSAIAVATAGISRDEVLGRLERGEL